MVARMPKPYPPVTAPLAATDSAPVPAVYALIPSVAPVIVELKMSVKLVPLVPVRFSPTPDVVTTLKVLSVVTTNDGPVKVTVVLYAPESTCAAAIGGSSSPLPSATETASADIEMPADSAPICGDMLAARPFHLVIRPPRKIIAEKLQIGLTDDVEVFDFMTSPSY